MPTLPAFRYNVFTIAPDPSLVNTFTLFWVKSVLLVPEVRVKPPVPVTVRVPEDVEMVCAPVRVIDPAIVRRLAVSTMMLSAIVFVPHLTIVPAVPVTALTTPDAPLSIPVSDVAKVDVPVTVRPPVTVKTLPDQAKLAELFSVVVVSAKIIEFAVNVRKFDAILGIIKPPSCALSFIVKNLLSVTYVISPVPPTNDW
jgi:hypothetical protein